jgi:hypothetical protein
MANLAARRVLFVVAVLAAALVGLALLTEPLEPGHGGAAEGPPDASAMPAGEPGDAAIAFEAGGRVAYGTEIRNGGLLPVTIDGLTPGQGGGLLTDLRLGLLRDPGMLDIGDASLRPFEPVTLGPGDSTFIAVVGRFVDCRTAIDHFSPGAGVHVQELWLDVHILGLPRVAHVPLRLIFELMGPAVRSCPA